MIDYSTPRFRTSEVAKVAGLTPPTLRSYFSRGQFIQIGLDHRAPDSEGLPALFSLRDVLTIATAARLISGGAQPAPAFQAALRWAHSGTDDRLPAQLYQQGDTVLIFYPESGHSKTLLANGAIAISDLFSDITASRHGYLYPAPILVLLNDIQDTVFAALGV